MTGLRTAMLLFAAALAGCAGPTLVSSEDVGTVTSCSVIAASWRNVGDVTRIETTGGVFHAEGIKSVVKGKRVTLHRYNNGQHFIAIEGLRRALYVGSD